MTGRATIRLSKKDRDGVDWQSNYKALKKR
jgi:hypothetical protein